MTFIEFQIISRILTTKDFAFQDGSIENLTDGVRHLGEQLATAQTDETVEALLGDEDESFLFASLASDPGT